MTAEEILEIARREIGTKETPANSNRVKYNTAYYGKEVSGGKYNWCCAFVWWCFREAGASSLFYGGGKTAYCPTLKSYCRDRHAAVPPDQPLLRPGHRLRYPHSDPVLHRGLHQRHRWHL